MDIIPNEVFVSDISDLDDTQDEKQMITKNEPRRKYKTVGTSERYQKYGTYVGSPTKDRQEYYRNYMNEPIKCPLCFTITSRGHLNRHKKTTICKKIQSIILDCDAYTTS